MEIIIIIVIIIFNYTDTIFYCYFMMTINDHHSIILKLF